MIDESLKSGPLPDVVEVYERFIGRGRPIAYDASLGLLIFERIRDDKLTSVIDYTAHARPVVPKVPTDEDARRRPKVRFRDGTTEPWQQGTLKGVFECGSYRFSCEMKNGSGGNFTFCELLE